jgi:predicted metal-dependent phosphoesterase TrpH
MKLKSNLHMHVAGDPEDTITYTLREAIDIAQKLGFSVLAVTPHNARIGDASDIAYAAARGILLILGIERTIEKAHVLILNVSPEADAIRTFEDLAQYKEGHPESFIIAPHPFFPAGYALGKKFFRNRHLFDAIEFSWFFSKTVNCNIKAEYTAKTYALPYIATSDTHNIDFLDSGYAIIDADEKNTEKVFDAIRNHAFHNVCLPKKNSTLVKYMLGRYATQLYGLLKKNLLLKRK